VELAKSGRVLMPLKEPHALIALIWVANNKGYSIGFSTEQLMKDQDLADSLECLFRVVRHVDPACFEWDPISVQDQMSKSQDAPDYCPHAYGYVSYTRRGFRPYELHYFNTPEIGNSGHAGTVLGGTGIAVSNLSQSKDLASKFAFWVTSRDVQCGLYFDSGGQPGHGLAWESDHCNSASSNFFRNTRKTLEGAWIRPRHDGFLSFQESGSRVVSDYLRGVRDLQKAIDLINHLYQGSFI
jgi:multiple sugar transport system substrate-binding protein